MDGAWVLQVGVRWLHFAGLFAILGGAAFWRVAGRGIALPRSRRLTAVGQRVAAPLVVLSGLAWLALSLAGMAGGLAAALDPGFLRLFFLDTPFGAIGIVRLALLAALLVAAALPRRPMPAVSAAIAGVLLATQAWLGHAAEGGPAGSAMIASYLVHALAAALWLGGLPPLLLALAEDRRDGAAALTRFSLAATLAACAVVASGIANTVFHAGTDMATLAASGYGRVLGAKLAFVAAMLLLAAATRFRTMPRMRWCEAARPSRAVALELAAGIAALAAAAVLGITAPPR